MDYNDDSWRNNLFFNTNKMSINEIINCMISRYHEKYDELLQDCFPEFYNYSKRVCDILNNSGNFRKNLHTDDVTIYNVETEKKEFGRPSDNVLEYAIKDNAFKDYEIERKKALKINLGNKWLLFFQDEDDNKFVPSILSLPLENSVKFINSIPFSYEYPYIHGDTNTSYRAFPCAIPKKFVDDVLNELNTDKDLENLYFKFKYAYSTEKMEKISSLKKEYADLLLNQMIEIDNKNCRYFKLEVLDYDKPIEFENLGLVLYDENLQIVDVIEKITSLKTAELKRENLRYKRLLKYKTSKKPVEEYLNTSEFALQEKYNKELKALKNKQEVTRRQEELQERLNHSIIVHEERKRKKKNAINQIAESIEVISVLGEDEKIDIPLELLFDWNKGKNCYQIKEEFKDRLKYIDLSCFSFENVDVSGIDFRGCNPTLLDPQKVYNKDLSDTRFDISEDEYDEKSGKVSYIPSSSWNLDGVTLNGSNLYVPSDYVKSNGLSMPINIDKATINDKTILPDVWKDKLKEGNSSYDNLVIEELLLNLIKNGESLNLVSKEEASMLKNYYIKEPEENKGGKTL